MINPFRDTNWRPTTTGLRAFAHALIGGIPLLAVVFAVFVRWRDGAWPMWPVALVLCGEFAGCLFLVAPRLARPFYLAWYFVACCIGLVLGNVILALVFYLVITPIGLFLRASGRDPMRRKFDRNALTYWLPAEKPPDPRTYFRQF